MEIGNLNQINRNKLETRARIEIEISSVQAVVRVQAEIDIIKNKSYHVHVYLFYEQIRAVVRPRSKFKILGACFIRFIRLLYQYLCSGMEWNIIKIMSRKSLVFAV